ncbi:hypothetical protein ID858_16530 [Xenorhabdus sp. DI]|uniref:hypothetical protein n=1 Tax=Xenorhabdus doucetiae TaxID=351671 RepID=UPI00199A6B45|nr:MULTISPECIES: hypothetical protein [unclassified Xenorhabdus]MBD2786480.1 hypothetical protein [Xenorhabdus sp. 3]MBD2790099.1 hypothetical protein [Xenorhabdus sp. DI]
MNPIFLPVPDDTGVASHHPVFTAQVTGLMDYPAPGTYQRERTLTVCAAPTITEAVQKLETLHLAGDWPVQDGGLSGFIPQTVMIYDRHGRKVLGGRFDAGIVWAQPVTLASERLSLEKQRQRLCHAAVAEQGWENYPDARMLWQKAHLLSLHLVSSRYRQCSEVNDILRHGTAVKA